LRCLPGQWPLPNLYLDLQNYQQFVQQLPLDVIVSGEIQESLGLISEISELFSYLSGYLSFLCTCLRFCVKCSINPVQRYVVSHEAFRHCALQGKRSGVV
jgi:hypothetical protein